MRDALRGLTGEGWVLGIASAFAIGYTAATLVASLAQMVVDAIQAGHVGPFTPYSFEIGGHGVYFERPLSNGAAFLVVLLVVAFGRRVLQAMGRTPQDGEHA